MITLPSRCAAALLAVGSSALPAFAQGTLCNAPEQMVWSCTAKGKIYSLCMVAGKDASPGSLWYRAGTPQHIEFTFPNAPGKPADFFKYELRGKIGAVRFVNGHYAYEIEESIYGNADIEIEKDGKSIGNVECGESTDTLTLTKTMNTFKTLGIYR